MKIINLVLASGKGSRLSPISTEEKPKQFLKINNYLSMLDNTIFRYFSLVDHVSVVTLKKYEKWISNKLPDMLFEPKRNESAYSVLFALEALERKYGDCIIIQTPSDHHIRFHQSFIYTLKEGILLAKKGRIVAVGVEPTAADSNLGYMKHVGLEVDFVEKPDQETAKQLIKERYLWNTAIYIYRLSDVLNEYKYFERKMVNQSLEARYEGEPKQFEKAIIKHTPYLKIIKGFFYWDDIGTIKKLEQFGGFDVVRKKNETN